VSSRYAHKKIGLIGTKRTVLSGVYSSKIAALKKDITLHALATPLLVHVVEEGFYDTKIADAVIAEYLSDKSLQNIEALILGCTHYPLLKKRIANYYNNRVEVIDSSEAVALSLQKSIIGLGLESHQEKGAHTFYVSDFTLSFQASTRLFFGEDVTLVHYKLWE